MIKHGNRQISLYWEIASYKQKGRSRGQTAFYKRLSSRVDRQSVKLKLNDIKLRG